MSNPTKHRFDHDEARARVEGGESIREVAKALSVGPTAVWKALHPDVKEVRKVGDAKCDDCGGAMNSSSRRSGSVRCRSCGQKHRHKQAKETNQ